MAGLLEAHRQRILDYAARHIPAELRRLIEPQDVLQDTFFEAFRRLNGFTATDADSADRWLVTIARNRISSIVKRHRAIKRGGGLAPLDLQAAATDPAAMETLLAELAVYERTPSKSAMAHELAAALERAIARLKPHYADAIRLRYVERVGVAEVAARLGRTERAAQMVCHRALQVLRDELRSASDYV